MSGSPQPTNGTLHQAGNPCHPHSMSVRTEFGQGMTDRRTKVDIRCDRNHKTCLTSSISDKEGQTRLHEKTNVVF